MVGLLFLLLSSFSFAHAVQIDAYSDYARSWCQEYVYNERALIGEQDLAHIRRLIELSRDRAAYTLEVQAYAWQTMNLFWQGWQNFAQTRLNPSKERPYSLSFDEQQRTQDFWSMLEMHEELCKLYGDHASAVVYGDLLKSMLAKDAVEQMRKQVRVCMLDALTDVKMQLEALYNITFKQPDEVLLQELVTEDESQRGFNLSTFLMNYLPNLVVHKFIKADAFYAVLSEEGWAIQDKIQRIGNQAWHAIETARVAFYQALIDELDAIS